MSSLRRSRLKVKAKELVLSIDMVYSIDTAKGDSKWPVNIGNRR
jgi:hypothetical protein